MCLEINNSVNTAVFLLFWQETLYVEITRPTLADVAESVLTELETNRVILCEEHPREHITGTTETSQEFHTKRPEVLKQLTQVLLSHTEPAVLHKPCSLTAACTNNDSYRASSLACTDIALFCTSIQKLATGLADNHINVTAWLENFSPTLSQFSPSLGERPEFILFLHGSTSDGNNSSAHLGVKLRRWRCQGTLR